MEQNEVQSEIVQDVNTKEVPKNNNKEKTSKILWIISLVSLAICIVLTAFFAKSVISHLTATDDQKLGTTFGLIVFIAYFGVPSLIFGSLATVLSAVSVILAKQIRILKLITMIVSALVLIACIVLFILI